MPWWRRRARHRPRRITGRGPGPAALAPEPTLPQPLAAIDERTPEASAAAARNPRHGCVGVGEGEREGAGRGAKTEGDGVDEGGGSGGSVGSVASGASGCVVGSSGRWGDRVGGSGGGSGGSSGGSNDSDGDGKQEPHGAPQDKS